MNEELAAYFSGQQLYGDDFTIEQIEEWYEDEAEGYANLGAREQDRYNYVYHRLNLLHGFKFVGETKFDEALGLGSAYGEEFGPIAHNVNKLTILDSSDAFSQVNEICGTPCKFIKPRPDGNMPFESGRFDLITCLGVMHHIPNVSHVTSECYRCLNNGGIMLLREPIVSMGDWRLPRAGLTKRERGIPLEILNKIIEQVGFNVKHRSLCCFPPISIIANKLGFAAYNNRAFTVTDFLLSKIFSWNIKYHRTKMHEKFAPSSVFYVLEK